jgi:hypothetical protein
MISTVEEIHCSVCTADASLLLLLLLLLYLFALSDASSIVSFLLSAAVSEHGIRF